MAVVAVQLTPVWSSVGVSLVADDVPSLWAAPSPLQWAAVAFQWEGLPLLLPTTLLSTSLETPESFPTISKGRKQVSLWCRLRIHPF